MKLLRIDDLPIYLNSSTTPNPNHKAFIPRKSANYDPDILGRDRNYYRKNVTPLRTVSKNGPSFKVNGYHVSWQKFQFRFGFNMREGLVLYDISYEDGSKRRPLIYRMSLSEMIVPYGDPRSPYQHKAVSELGT